MTFDWHAKAQWDFGSCGSTSTRSLGQPVGLADEDAEPLAGARGAENPPVISSSVGFMHSSGGSGNCAQFSGSGHPIPNSSRIEKQSAFTCNKPRSCTNPQGKQWCTSGSCLQSRLTRQSTFAYYDWCPPVRLGSARNEPREARLIGWKSREKRAGRQLATDQTGGAGNHASHIKISCCESGASEIWPECQK